MNFFLKLLIISAFFTVLQNCSKNKKEEIPKIESTYPFTKVSYIEILSYEDRMTWDNQTKEVIEKGKVRIPKEDIKQKVKLNYNEVNQLFNILYSKTKEECLIADCFQPRNAIIFYDKNDKAFACIELCLECSTLSYSLGVVPIECLHAKKEQLINFFNSVGLKTPKL